MVEYRKRWGSGYSVWHFSPTCPKWPTQAYAQRDAPEGPVCEHCPKANDDEE